MVRRSARLAEIEGRILRLDEQAAQLLHRERTIAEEITTLERALESPGSRLATRRTERALRRHQAKLTQLTEQRRRLVEDQMRAIMFALQEQAQRTRDELDRQLDLLVPVQERWERLRGAFDALETTISGPAFASLAEQWQGQLEIPDFPVAQHAGYSKPFPQHAVLF